MKVSALLAVTRLLRVYLPQGEDAFHPHLPPGLRQIDINVGSIAQGKPARLSLEAAALAHVETSTRAFVQTLIEADVLGTDVSATFREYLDDCGTKPWPLPRKWPRPWWLLPPTERLDDTGKPQPQPWLTQQMQLVAALVLADVGDQLDSDLGTTLVEGAARLSEAAIVDAG